MQAKTLINFKSSSWLFYKIVFAFRGRLKNNKKQYMLIQVSLDFELFGALIHITQPVAMLASHE